MHLKRSLILLSCLLAVGGGFMAGCQPVGSPVLAFAAQAGPGEMGNLTVSLGVTPPGTHDVVLVLNGAESFRWQGKLQGTQWELGLSKMPAGAMTGLAYALDAQGHRLMAASQGATIRGGQSVAMVFTFVARPIGNGGAEDRPTVPTAAPKPDPTPTPQPTAKTGGGGGGGGGPATLPPGAVIPLVGGTAS